MVSMRNKKNYHQITPSYLELSLNNMALNANLPMGSALMSFYFAFIVHICKLEHLSIILPEEIYARFRRNGPGCGRAPDS